MHISSDLQRQKVCDAERAIYEEFAGERIDEVSDIGEYIKRLASHGWFKKRFGEHWYVRTVGGFGKSRCYRHEGCMGIPRWSRTEIAILHEVAHTLQHPRTQRHGREFCMIYMELVRLAVGKEVYKALKRRFQELKVEHTSIRKGEPISEAALDWLQRHRDTLDAEAHNRKPNAPHD
jgi:putative metallohydrolase (TIGR04338 family)